MKTSRIKIKVPKVATLTYEHVAMGEVFVSGDIAHMKLKDTQCISLHSGLIKTLQPGDLVDMMEAELILKFREEEK